MANHIPNELLLDAFKFIDGIELRSFKEVSRKWNKLFHAQENFLALRRITLVCNINSFDVSTIKKFDKNVFFERLDLQLSGDKKYYQEQKMVR